MNQDISLKVTEELYNSGLAYTVMTTDGEEVTDGHSSMLGAIVEWLANRDIAYLNTTLSISDSVSGSDQAFEIISGLVESDGFGTTYSKNILTKSTVFSFYELFPL